MPFSGKNIAEREYIIRKYVLINVLSHEIKNSVFVSLEWGFYVCIYREQASSIGAAMFLLNPRMDQQF